jgi:ribosomal protein S11
VAYVTKAVCLAADRGREPTPRLGAVGFSDYKKDIMDSSNLKAGSAFVLVRRSFSNLFISLLDPFNRIIITKTSGSVKVIGSQKKKKVSPHAAEFIIKELSSVFKARNIISVFIILKCRVSAHVYLMVKELMVLGIQIKGILDRRVAAHNGLRAKRMRRV